MPIQIRDPSDDQDAPALSVCWRIPTARRTTRGEHRRSRRVAKLDRLRRGVNLLLPALLTAGAAACTRTASPAPVPSALEPWTTPMESVRRDAGAEYAAPTQPVEEWREDAGDGIKAPLALRSNLLIATTTDRRVVVFSAEDGEFLWERRLRGVPSGSAVFDRDAVYVGSQEDDSYAQAFELERGFELWDRAMSPPSAAPLLDGGRTYWPTLSGQVLAIEGGGEVIWRARLPGSAVTTPVPHPSGLLVATSADTLYRLETGTGIIDARLPLPATPTAMPAMSGNRMLLPLHDTTIVAVDVQDWAVSDTVRLGGLVRAAPVVDGDGTVYLLTEETRVWSWRPGSDPLRLADLGGAARASLALARNGLLVGRLDGELFLIDFDGSVIWSKDMEDSLEAPALAHEGSVYVPLLRGQIVRLRQAGS